MTRHAFRRPSAFRVRPLAVTLAALLGAALPASSVLAQSSVAETPGSAYVSAGAGAARVAMDCSGTTSCDRTSAGYRVLGGVHIGPRWAAELVYFDWGHADAAVADSGVTAEVRQRGTGLGLGMAYVAPVAPEWQVAVRFGVASNKSRLDSGSVVAGVPVTVRQSSRHTEPYVGVGMGYAIDRNWAVDATADFSRLRHTSTVGGVSLDDRADVQQLGVSLRYRF